ncbi:MAG: hypothetical protein EOM72_10885 [Opitutae bacterium]|nr:hypothetical protein [Opitutae bacterium]
MPAKGAAVGHRESRANAGDFAGAIQAAARALARARQGGGHDLAAQIESRLSAYRQKLAWRERV